MENASKALLIAGAILIVIVLIGIGVMIINSTGNMQDQVGSTADTMAVQTFNSNFTNYEGSKVTASQIKALFSLIRSSNASNGYGGRMLTTQPTANTTEDKYVCLDSKSSVTSTTSLSNNDKYKVEITGYSAGGYVQTIKITQ